MTTSCSPSSQVRCSTSSSRQVRSRPSASARCRPVSSSSAHRSALSHRHQRERLASLPEAGVVDHRLQVTDPRLERVVGDVPVGQPMTALVEPDDRGEPADIVEEVSPYGALPVELEVTEPARRDDERRAAAMDRIRDPHAVWGAAEPDLLRGISASRRAGGMARCYARQQSNWAQSASSTTTGAWSEAPFPLRSSRSIAAPSTRAASTGEARTKSIRMPRFLANRSCW